VYGAFKISVYKKSEILFFSTDGKKKEIKGFLPSIADYKHYTLYTHYTINNKE